jgi:uncharacterized protein YecT (DUF1311 family)
MRGIAAFVGCGLILAGASAQAADPSFDCFNAKGAMENLLCADGGLGALDQAMADAFGKLKGRPDYKDIVAGQRAWLKTRDAACPAPKVDWSAEKWPVEAMWKAAACLAPLYRQRLNELGAQAQSQAAPPAGAIHPSCVELALLRGPMPLETCNAGFAHNPPYLNDAWLFADGTRNGPLSASFGYRIAGKAPDGGEVAQIAYSGGGTGQFSTVAVLKSAPGSDGKALLSAKPVPGAEGGDRCNGGIDTVTIDNGALLVTRNLSPLDMASVLGSRAAKVEGDNALAFCAACCVGTATTRQSFDGKGTPRVERVAFESDEGLTVLKDDTPLNRCFAKAVTALAPKFPATLAGPQVTALAKALDACVK